MRKKILYIITQGAWGGAQRYVFDLATQLATDFDITVAVGEPLGPRDLQNKLSEPAWRGKIAVVQLRHLVRAISPYHDTLAVVEIAKLYDRLQPACVHLNSSKTSIVGTIAVLFIHRLAERPLKLIYTVHGWVFNEPGNPLKRLAYRWLEQLTSRKKSMVIVISEQDRETGLRLRIPSGKITLISLGLNPTSLPSQSEAREILNKKTTAGFGKITQQTTLIGITANLYPTKGLDIFIHAIAQNERLRNTTKTIIIGDGPERSKLNALIVRNSLTNIVSLVGNIPNAETLLPAFDLFVLPSRKEGFPYVLLEAASANIPIIAAGVGGVPGLIKNQQTGLLVPSENSKALGAAVEFALASRSAMELYAQAANLLYREKFSLAAMLHKTATLYRSI